MTSLAPSSPVDPCDPASVQDLLATALPPASPLWPTLAHLDWAMVLPNAAAPGYVYLAASCAGMPIGGGGLTLAEATSRCAGEAAEVLAQRTAQPPSTDPADPAIDALWLAPRNETDAPRFAARRLGRNAAIGIPAAALRPDLPRVAHAPPASLGLAAHPDPATARQAALLELVERDAAARWWNGGASPHALPAAEMTEAATTLATARHRAPGTSRPTWLFRLTGPTGIPVICAASRDPTGGRGLVLGLKAAFDAHEAATGAILELLQMEIALEIARHRAAKDAATPGDAGPLARADLDLTAFPAFALRPPPGEPDTGPATMVALAQRLDALGIATAIADLAVPPGVLPVAKAVATGLAPLPGGTERPDPHAPGAIAALM